MGCFVVEDYFECGRTNAVFGAGPAKRIPGMEPLT